METTITSIVCIALIVVGGMTMSQNLLASVDSSAAGLEQIALRDDEIMKTDISPLSVSSTPQRVDISLKNTGQTKLASFSQWDVIIQYRHGTDYYAKWLPYVTGTPGNNEWTVRGIYLDVASRTPELSELNILNPGEEMQIRAELSPNMSNSQTVVAIVSTPNGVPMTVTFEK